MREYTDQEICQIIQDYDRIIQELRYGVEAFVRELVSLDSNDDWLCSILALQHSGTGSATTHSSLHDLSDLLKNKNLKEWNTPANCKRESTKSWKQLTVYKKYIDVICAYRVKNMKFCSSCMKNPYLGTKSRKHYKLLCKRSREGENMH